MSSWLVAVRLRAPEGTHVTNRVREMRCERDLTQLALAQVLGVSRQTINAIETGRYLPSLPLALKTAQLFGVPVEEIFHLEDTAT